MKKQLQGITIPLLNVLLMLGFNSVGWQYILDFDFEWQHIFMVLGIVGTVIVFCLIKRISKFQSAKEE